MADSRGKVLYDFRPRQLGPIPWGWENDPSGSWVVRPRGEIAMPVLVDYFDWEGVWEARPLPHFTEGGLGSTSMKSVFTTACRFLGTEEALIKLYRGELREGLWQIAREMLAWNKALLGNWPGEPGRMVLGDDVAGNLGMIMSPNLYRREILPLHRNFVELAWMRGWEIWFHSDGDISEIAGDVSQAGFDGVYFEDIGDVALSLQWFDLAGVVVRHV